MIEGTREVDEKIIDRSQFYQIIEGGKRSNSSNYSFIGIGKIHSGNDSTNVGYAAISSVNSTGDSSRAFGPSSIYRVASGTYIKPICEQINITQLNSGFVVKVGTQSFAIESTEKLIDKMSLYLRNPSDINIWLHESEQPSGHFPNSDINNTGGKVYHHPGSTSNNQTYSFVAQGLSNSATTCYQSIRTEKCDLPKGHMVDGHNL